MADDAAKPSSPATPEQAFAQGAQLLATGKASQAVPIFQAIRATGSTSASLEGNLGRALVDSGQLGPGIASLMNAVELDRLEGSYRSDLEVAQARVEGGMGLPMSHPSEWGYRFGSYIRPPEFFSLAVLVALLTFALFLFFEGARRKRWLIAGLVLSLVMAAGGMLAYTGESITVVTNESPLKSAPLASSESSLALKPGTRVRVIRRSGDFAEIERANAFRGWVATGDLSL